MDKNIGLNRNLQFAWLDAVAALCAETNDLAELRSRLEPIVGLHLKGVEARRKTIDILLNIWVKSDDLVPGLRREAVNCFQTAPQVSDRVWLHYGLTLVRYPFFRQIVATIGQIGRVEGVVTTSQVEQKMALERGQLGSLARATGRVLSSLRDWKVLLPSDERHAYVPQRQSFSAADQALEAWLLACALRAHPAEELPFADLLHLVELFPFRFTLSVDHLRESRWFTVQRQGLGWDMVGLNLSEV